MFTAQQLDLAAANVEVVAAKQQAAAAQASAADRVRTADARLAHATANNHRLKHKVCVSADMFRPSSHPPTRAANQHLPVVVHYHLPTR